MSELNNLVNLNDLVGIKEFLIKNKNQINFFDKNGHSALHLACLNNNEDIVKILISVPGIDINLLTKDMTPLYYLDNEKDTETALHIACIEGNKNIVDLLLSVESIDVNCVAGNGDTPLHVACYSEQSIEIVKSLTSNPSTNINCLDFYGNTPLYLSCMENAYEVVKHLIGCNGIDVFLKNKFGESAIECAKYNENEKIINLLENV